MTRTLLWHDYEAFGADPRRDRPAQFAAIRTDEQLNEVGEPLMWYCAPPLDYLPSPTACLITAITPQLAARKGTGVYPQHPGGLQPARHLRCGLQHPAL